MIGNVFEWYDIMVYSAFTPIITKHFFPHVSELAGLIATFGVFGVGYLARPLGGTLLGIYGDRGGRVKSITLAIAAMAICSGGIGLLPTYATIGAFAPLLLLLLRIIQGMSLGGEYAGAITIVGEHAPQGKRGFYLSLLSMATSLGQVLGVVVSLGMIGIFGEQLVSDWLWRFAFLLGAGIGIVGFYLRRRVQESNEFASLQHSGHLSDSPLRESVQRSRLPLLTAGITVLAVTMVAKYLALTYIPSYLQTSGGNSMNTGLSFSLAYMITIIILIPLCGLLSDHIGIKKVTLFSVFSLSVLSVPIFIMLSSQSKIIIIGAGVLYGVLACGSNATWPNILANLFPSRVRFRPRSAS